MPLLRQNYRINRIKNEPVNRANNWRWAGCLALFLLLSACGPGTDKDVRNSYEQALPHARAMLSAETYRTALEEYSVATSFLGESPNAVSRPDLTNGTTNIFAGFSLDEFIALGEELRPLAAAEQEILACATALAMHNNTREERSFNFILIAEAHAEAGNNAAASNLLTMASEATCSKTNQLDQAHAYTRIAEVYDSIGAEALANHAAATAERLALLPSEGADHRNTFSKTYALTQAIMRHLATGNEERSRVLMQFIVASLPNEGHFYNVNTLADEFDEEGYFDLAMEILKNASPEDNSLSYTICGMAERERDIDELMQLADFALTIQDEYDRDHTLSSLAAHFAARGHYMSARMLQASIENTFCSDDELWVKTVRDYASERRINAAFKTVDLMHEKDDRVEALLVIATALADQGHRQYAVNTLTTALNIALTHSYWPDYEQVGKVAVKYAELGYPKQSKELLDHHTAEALALDRAWTKANALNDLAAAHIQLNELETASKLLIQAREVLKEEPKSGLTFNHIAENLAIVEQCKEAFNTAEMIPNDSRYKESAYRDLVQPFSIAGEEDLMERCLEKMADDFYRARLLVELVEIYLEQGEPDRALALADRLEKEYARHDALTLTALHHAGLNDFNHAFETTRLITNISSQVSAFVDIAEEFPLTRPLRPEEMDMLSLVIADQYPIDYFWLQHGIKQKKNDDSNP